MGKGTARVGCAMGSLAEVEVVLSPYLSPIPTDMCHALEGYAAQFVEQSP